MNDNQLPVQTETDDIPVVLTEDGDEQNSWSVQTTFYFEQGLLSERDADLITAGLTV